MSVYGSSLLYPSEQLPGLRTGRILQYISCIYALYLACLHTLFAWSPAGSSPTPLSSHRTPANWLQAVAPPSQPAILPSTGYFPLNQQPAIRTSSLL